ncbi:agmatine deiminase family protein [Pelomonas aquatica]|uniref:agmatine deiminase family protein n=1 Tax=Pelomonas aquatica TaxID=431058 RepID=UPI00360C0F09
MTDGHTDFYARFTQSGVVVAGLDEDPASYDHAVTRRHLELLRQARDARGRRLQVVVMRGPGRVRPALENPRHAARAVPPARGGALNIDGIAAGGGGIHCTTQQEPG